jgi:hypothetical protein
MKRDYAFDIFFTTLILGPMVAVVLTGNWFWLLAYLVVALIVGM